MAVLRFLIVLLSCCAAAAAQEGLTLEQAVRRVREQYPSVRVSQAQVRAAAAGIQLARTSYLPRLEAIAGVNRATRNNVFGLLLPSQILAPISGPVLGTNNLTNVWGSTAGFLVSWEPFDFGLRQANVAVAEAGRSRAQAAAVRTSFEVSALAADAYLTVLAADETVRAATAGVERARVLERVVGALVKAELRPGVEESRTRAEIAAAENQVIQAEQAAAVARAVLGELLGAPASTLAVGRLLDTAPGTGLTGVAQNNPVLQEQNAAIAEVQAREKALERSYVPRFNLQGTAYARGSGANPDGTVGGGAAGLGPTVQNWAVGFTVNFPLLDLPALKYRRGIEKAREEAEVARYSQLQQEIQGRVAQAEATLQGARRMANNTPVQLAAAQAAERQASARYQAGLSTIVEVADAQRLLTQAEIDNGLARLNVWRALLGVAVAGGDLEPFLQFTRP